MSIIIKLQGLPLDATSVDVRRYFLGLTIPDGGVHILGGDEGTVFIEFASDEDARQAMSRGDGKINNSNIKLMLSSRTEMVSLLDVARQLHQNYLQQSQTQPQSQPQTQSFNNTYQHQNTQHQHSNNILVDPRLLSQNYLGIMSSQAPQSAQPQQQLLLPQQGPIFNQYPTPTTTAASLLGNMSMLGGVDMGALGAVGGLNSLMTGQVSGLNLLQPGGVGGILGPNGSNNNTVNIDQQNNNNDSNRNLPSDNRGRGVSGMRGGDDKLFANKRCVLAASNIPYRANSKDIIEFLSEFNLKEESIRRRYNAKGQPTADAKIAFPTPEAAAKALKMMNKKTLCGRPVFFKPV